MNSFYFGGIGICFIISFVLFKKSAGTLDPGKINIISGFYYLFLLQTFLGISLIVLGFDKHYTLDRLILRKGTINITFVIIMILSVVIPLCMIMWQRVLRMRPKVDYLKYLKDETCMYNTNIVYRVVLICIIICSILMIAWFIKIGYIPAFKLFFASDDFNFAIERKRISNSYLIHPYISNILILTFIPLLSYIACAYALVSKSQKWYILFFITFIESLMVKTYNFEKAPIIYYIAVFILIYIIYKGCISWKILSLFAVLSVGAIILLYKATGFTGKVFDLYNGPVGRTIFSQLGSLLCIFDAFPKYFGFLKGRSLSGTVLPLLGMSKDMHIRSGKLMMEFYGSEGIYDGTAGVLNGFFVGEAYANYGVGGIVFSVLWVTFLFVLILKISMKVKKTPITIAFLATMSLKMIMISQGGFFDYIFSVDLLFTCLVYGSGYLFLERGKIFGDMMKSRKRGQWNDRENINSHS